MRHPRTQRFPQALTHASVAAAVVVLSGMAGSSVAADWPQWRGEHRDGKSSESGLLQSWPEDGPTLLMTATGLGGGFSSVSVAGEQIFTMGDLGDAQYAIGLDRANGSILWKTPIGPAWKDKYLGPRSTPTVDGNRIYLLSTEGDLYCLKTDDGAVVWKKNLPKSYGAKMMIAGGKWDWKFSESPLVDGDRVLVTPGTAEAAIVALNRKNGDEIWRAPMPALGEHGTDGAGYSSIVISKAAGVRQYVQFLGRGAIGVSEDGRFLWGYNRIANDVANIATPLVHEDHVFVSSGYGTGSALLKIVKQGDGLTAQEVYFLEGDALQNHHGGLVLLDGIVYTGTGHNKGLPIAVRMDSGEAAWGPVRNEGKSSAAIAYADGRLYFRYQDGRMILIEATPEGYREHGSFMIPDVDQPSWPHPVIAGGRLYLREQDRLYVYDLAGGGK